jgi:GT2 family glycosyltransferase
LKIAVVIINYNSGDLLAKCIDHLLAQSRPADAIVIVDNASQDNSMANLPANPEISICKLETNQGFASANNIAFRQLSDAEYFITLNPDAFPRFDFIEKLEDAARDHPGYASFATRTMVSETTVDGAGDVYHISGLAWRKFHNRRYVPDQHQPRDVFSPCAGAAMYRAADLIQVGGFDDSFFCYMEDIDLGYRLQLKGKRCLYVPEANALHIGSAIVSKYPGFAVYYGHRNLVWTMVKNTPGPLLPLVLPAHLAMSVLLAAIFLARGQLRVYLRAKFDALQGLGRVWGQRKQVQKTRQVSCWRVLRLYDFRLKQ